MRTYVRVKQRSIDPPRRSRRLLRVGRAAGRPELARPPGHRRRWGWCSRRATRPRPSACAPRWARRPHGGCARTRGRPAPDVGLLRGEQGGIPGLRGHDRRSSRVCRSTRRSSMSTAWSGASDRRPRSPFGFARTSVSRSACRSRSGSPGRSSSPRSRAASPSPTGSSSCRRTRSSPSSIRSTVERLWGVGPVTAGKLRGRGITTVERARAPAERRSWRCSVARRPAPPRACPQPRSAPRAGRPPPRVDRLTARTRAVRPGRASPSTPTSWPSSTG